MALNEINTVQDLWAKFGSGYWHNWPPTQCIVNNEIPKDVFNVANGYGDTEAVKLDDISLKEIRVWRYTFTESSVNVSFSNTGGTQTIQINSWKQEYVNGSPVGSVIGLPFTIDSSLSSYSGFSASVNASNNTLNISCSENVGSAKSGFIFLRQGETGTLSNVIMISQPAATFSTREDLYAQPSQWQWNYNEGGSGVGKTFEVISETVSLRNGQVISRSPKNFSYSVTGDYNAQFYAGKDSSTIIRAFPVMQNNTSTSYYASILLTRSGATDFHINLYQQKRY